MFLKLVNAQFPELFDVTTLLMEEGLSTSATSVTATPGPATLVPSLTVSLKSAKTQSSGVSAYLESHYHSIGRHIEYPEAAVKGNR